MTEKTLDLNNEEKQTPTGNDQPGEKSPESSEEEEEIDNILSSSQEEEEEIKPESSDEDSVVLSKSDWEKAQKRIRDGQNYKKGLLSLRRKQKASKKQATETLVPKESEFITKKEFYQANEKEAIRQACENPEIDENWDKIVPYYVPRRGKNSPKDIKLDIEDAFYLYQKDNPNNGEKEDKRANAQLSTDRGTSGSEAPKGKEKKRGGIIPKAQPVQEWYGKPEE